MAVDKLQKAWEKRDWQWQELLSGVERLMKARVEAHRPIKVEKRGPVEREVVLFLSDLHFGSIVNASEVPGNEYDFNEANRRMQKVTHELVSYKPHHRKESSCRILMGGDMIEGRIHGDNRFIEPLSRQVYFCQMQMVSIVQAALEAYGRVSVTTAVGNHGRFPDKDRALQTKYDSLETLIFLFVKSWFRNDERVTVDVNDCVYSTWESPGGHACLLTHGDTFMHAGSIGKAINLSSISSQTRRINATRPKKIDVFAMGHYHVPTYTSLDDGTQLIINGCMVGTGAYAQSLGIVDSNPIQLMWESVPGYPVGDMRFIRCV